MALRSSTNFSAAAGSTNSARAPETFDRMPYTYSSTAFFRSLVSSMTRSCSAISNSSLTKVSSTALGKPPTTEDTGTSVLITRFFITGAAGSVSMGAASPSGAGGSGAGSGGTSSSISSTAAADSTETRPLRLRRTFTLSLVLPSGSLHLGTGPISKEPTESSALGGRRVGVVYLAWTEKVSLRKKVIIFDEGTGLLRSKSSMSFASPPSPTQLNDTGKGNESTTSKSRTLNWGESMAPWSAQPRATHSDAL